MSGRHIYVDIDDVLAETVERLVDLLAQLHGRSVDPRAVEHFDLSKSFGLDPDELEAFMEHVHTDPVIESIAPIPGAAPVLERWHAEGHRVTLVTGRPPSTNAASRRWLETHDLRHNRSIISTSGIGRAGTSRGCRRSASRRFPPSGSTMRWRTVWTRRSGWSRSSGSRWP